MKKPVTLEQKIWGLDSMSLEGRSSLVFRSGSDFNFEGPVGPNQNQANKKDQKTMKVMEGKRGIELNRAGNQEKSNVISGQVQRVQSQFVVPTKPREGEVVGLNPKGKSKENAGLGALHGQNGIVGTERQVCDFCGMRIGPGSESSHGKICTRWKSDCYSGDTHPDLLKYQKDRKVGPAVPGMSKMEANSAEYFKNSGVSKPTQLIPLPREDPSPAFRMSVVTNWFADFVFGKSKGLSKEKLALIPKLVVCRKIAGTQCNICLESFEEGQTIRRGKCGHLFHFKDCLEKWLKVNQVCPLCRTIVV